MSNDMIAVSIEDMFNNYPSINDVDRYMYSKFLEICNIILYDKNQVHIQIAYEEMYKIKSSIVKSASFTWTSSFEEVIKKIIREYDTAKRLNMYLSYDQQNMFDRLVIMMREQEEDIRVYRQRKHRKQQKHQNWYLKYPLRIRNFFINYYLDSDIEITDVTILKIIKSCLLLKEK